jgi:hypothetical protein
MLVDVYLIVAEESILRKEFAGCPDNNNKDGKWGYGKLGSLQEFFDSAKRLLKTHKFFFDLINR